MSLPLFFLFLWLYFTFPSTSVFPIDSLVTLSPNFTDMSEQVDWNASSALSGNGFEVDDEQKYMWHPIQKKDVYRWQRLHCVFTFFLPSISTQWTPKGNLHLRTLYYRELLALSGMGQFHWCRSCYRSIFWYILFYTPVSSIRCSPNKIAGHDVGEMCRCYLTLKNVNS